MWPDQVLKNKLIEMITQYFFSGNRPPVFNLSPDRFSLFDDVLTIIATVNESVTVQLNVSDPDGDSFTITLNGIIASDPNAVLDESK